MVILMMMMTPSILLTVFLYSSINAAALLNITNLGSAIDIDHPVSYDNLMNIRLNMISTIYIRAFDTYSYATFDKTMTQTIKNAYICRYNVELYMALNPYSSLSGGQQMENLYNGLKDNYICAYAVWIQVNDSSDWLKNPSKNVNLISSAIKTAKELGFRKIGIYTSSEDWNTITGNWTGSDSDILLWYYMNDSDSNFDDFKPFGSWSKPSVKQYKTNVTLEGTLLNRDVFEF